MTKSKFSVEDKVRKLEEELTKKRAELIRAKGRLSEEARKKRNRELIPHSGKRA